jgi:hexokinase
MSKFLFEPENLNRFARDWKFHYSGIDSFAVMEDFRRDMDRGLRGEASSLAMIPSYLVPASRAPRDVRVIALDAGGTNLRSALVYFDGEGKPVIEKTLRAPMPGTKGRLGAEAFFDELADVVIPLKKEADSIAGIGFCFSYPVNIGPDMDGTLIKFSKEIDAPEVVGKAIGAGLRAALERKGLPVKEQICLLNDTAAALLAGLGSGKADVSGERLIGYILGTGTNIAYPERVIPKINFDSPSPQIVVMESGGFALDYLSPLDIEFDKTLKNPGAYNFEKTMAGAYIGPLSLFVFKQALKDKALYLEKGDEFLALPTLETRDLNDFYRAALGAETEGAGNPIDAILGPAETEARKALVYLGGIISRRAGLFAAASLAATVKAQGRDPQEPVTIAVEGTTFMAFHGMRPAIEAELYRLLNAAGPRYYRMQPVEQASLLGAAIAALSPPWQEARIV